jgi:hypothetical protein
VHRIRVVESGERTEPVDAEADGEPVPATTQPGTVLDPHDVVPEALSPVSDPCLREAGSEPMRADHEEPAIVVGQ